MAMNVRLVSFWRAPTWRLAHGNFDFRDHINPVGTFRSHTGHALYASFMKRLEPIRNQIIWSGHIDSALGFCGDSCGSCRQSDERNENEDTCSSLHLIPPLGAEPVAKKEIAQ